MRLRGAFRNLTKVFRRDEGLTLAETVVSMAVGTLLLAAVASLTVRLIAYLDAQDKRTTATLQIANAMDLVAKQVRTTYKPGRPAVILAGPEAYGFYANVLSLPSGGAVNPTAAPLAYTPQEVWIWTETISGGRERLCDQVRPLTVGAGGAIVYPLPDLSIPANRTCHELVSRVSATKSDGSVAPATFRYLATDDPLGSSGISTSSLPLDAAGNVITTTDIDAVEISVVANAGTAKRPVVVTTTNRITFVNPQN